MKLLSFVAKGRPSYGAVIGDGVLDLGAQFGSDCPDLRSLLSSNKLEAARAAVARGKSDLALSEIAYAPVISNPDKIVCVGLNYRAHIAETGRTETERPVLFLRLTATQVGHLQPMLCPPESAELDYEGELAVIIGKPGRRIAQAEALKHVAGYACYNDGSVRDWQRHTHQWTPGKNFRGTGAFGPWMATADEIPDVDKLELTTRLNEETMQHASVGLLIFPIPELIAYISRFTDLLPGDVIVTGTPAGVGMKQNPPVFLRPGDEICVEIAGVGRLVNPVRSEGADGTC